MIKAVIFDLGNVIVNVNWNNLYKKFATDSNKSISYIKEYFENCSLRWAAERGEITSKEFYEGIKRELNLTTNFVAFKRAWCNMFSLNKDVAKLIKKLRKNFRLSLLSNTDKIHFEYIKNKFKVVNIFDEYVLSYEVGRRKPNPLIFITALKKAKALPFNCIYIDDIHQFVYIARLMGIRAFQFKGYEKLLQDLSDAKVLLQDTKI